MPLLTIAFVVAFFFFAAFFGAFFFANFLGTLLFAAARLAGVNFLPVLFDFVRVFFVFLLVAIWAV